MEVGFFTLDEVPFDRKLSFRIIRGERLEFGNESLGNFTILVGELLECQSWSLQEYGENIQIPLPY